MQHGTIRQISVLMATVFADMIGFTMVLPLLPFYATRCGASATVVGLLVAIYAFAQFVTAPLWGRASDRWGRRPMILFGLMASAVAYVFFGLADALWLLFASRLVQGMAGGINGVVQAYVADAVEPEERAKALGWLTAATSAGVAIGPVIGSAAANISREAPGFFAAALCILNVLSAWRWLPEVRRETAAPSESGAPAAPRTTLGRSFWEVVRHPRSPLSSLIWIYTFGMMAFLAMNTACIPFPTHLAGLALAVVFVPVGTALLFPATTALVSRRSLRGEVGQVLGVQQSFGSIARMVGPLWSGFVFQRVGQAYPFWLASILMLGVSLLTWRQRRGQPEPAAPAAVQA